MKSNGMCSFDYDLITLFSGTIKNNRSVIYLKNTFFHLYYITGKQKNSTDKRKTSSTSYIYLCKINL